MQRQCLARRDYQHEHLQQRVCRLYSLAEENSKTVTEESNNSSSVDSKEKPLQFSVVELLNDLKSSNQSLFSDFSSLQLEDVEEALLYLSKIGAMKLEGGFLVLYNAMAIKRTKELRLRYKQEDYRMLNEFYKQKSYCCSLLL